MKVIDLAAASAKLKQAKIGVIPTDTLYGLVASALIPEAVERIYQVKNRDLSKPSIVLIADPEDVDQFGVAERDKERADKFWPGPVSIILHVPSKKWQHLHRGTNSLAFRVPDEPHLQDFLRQTGPLVAPSANPQGEVPAATVQEAYAYFGDNVDFYVDAGTLNKKPSALISFLENEFKILRSHAKEDVDVYAKFIKAKTAAGVGKQITGFLDFIRERGVIGLAIGLVIGTAVTTLVNALVVQIINPLIGLLVSTENLNQATLKIGSAVIGWGAFASTLINFLLITAIIYFGFKALHLDKLDKKKD